MALKSSREPEQVLEAWRAAFAAANNCEPPKRGKYVGLGWYRLGTSKRHRAKQLEEYTARLWARVEARQSP